MLKVAVKKNAMLLGASLDQVHPLAGRLPYGELYGAVQQQALMVSMKELYGWLALAGLFGLLLLALNESELRPLHALHPRYRAIRRYVKHELRMRRL